MKIDKTAFERLLRFIEKFPHYFIGSNADLPNNTITPIVRKREKLYEIDLVLRNNRTSEEHPLGIFHPHEDVQHIKKENIGLIEVMGLAVLPARLETELKEVKKYILNEENSIAEYHIQWANELKVKYTNEITIDTAENIVKKEIAYKFLRVLQDAGVFKTNEAGTEAFKRFINYLNII